VNVFTSTGLASREHDLPLALTERRSTFSKINRGGKPTPIAAMFAALSPDTQQEFIMTDTWISRRGRTFGIATSLIGIVAYIVCRLIFRNYWLDLGTPGDVTQTVNALYATVLASYAAVGFVILGAVIVMASFIKKSR
jgi:hypothetical protein